MVYQQRNTKTVRGKQIQKSYLVSSVYSKVVCRYFIIIEKQGNRSPWHSVLFTLILDQADDEITEPKSLSLESVAVLCYVVVQQGPLC